MSAAILATVKFPATRAKLGALTVVSAAMVVGEKLPPTFVKDGMLSVVNDAITVFIFIRSQSSAELSICKCLRERRLLSSKILVLLSSWVRRCSRQIQRHAPGTSI